MSKQTPKRYLTFDESLWRYNGLDCCVTHEVVEAFSPFMDEYQRRSYEFSMRMLAPALSMTLNGIAVDQPEVSKRLAEIDSSLLKLGDERDSREKMVATGVLGEIALAIWDKPLNPNSPKQLGEFLYDTIGLPEQTKFDHKTRRSKRTTDREALEKLRDEYGIVRPIINTILRIRELRKLKGVLESGIDPDGRMRFAFHPASTDSFRWASSENVMGRGTNAQNITDRVRRIFIADEEWKLGYFDLEQAESRVVAYESGDEAYIEACESEDLHTSVAQLIWPDLNWGHDPAHWRSVADLLFYRHHSYRDISKRDGHATNYFAKPHTIAKHSKIPEPLAAEFQNTYFSRFPGIREFHHWVARTLYKYAYLISVFSRKRYFLGRRDDEATLRKAISYLPQTTVCDILNIGIRRLYNQLVLSGKLKLLAQVHDAVLVMYREVDESWIVPLIIEILTFPVPMTDRIRGRTREMTIPIEGKVGWNWGSFNKKEPDENPGGLIKWSGQLDKRERPSAPSLSILDRRVYGIDPALSHHGNLPPLDGPEYLGGSP